VGPHRDADRELDQFDRLLGEWSRRDFLHGMGGAVAVSTLLAGGLEPLQACGGGGAAPRHPGGQGRPPGRGQHLRHRQHQPGVSKRVRNFDVAAWNIQSPRPWFKDVYVTDGK